MSKTLIEKLKKLAAKKTCVEKDINAFEASGVNYDDAFYAGWDDGEISLSREILEDLESNKI